MIRRLLLYLVLFLILFSTLDSGTDGSLYPFAVLGLTSALLLCLQAVALPPDSPPAPGATTVRRNPTLLALLLFSGWCAATLAYTIDRPSTEYGLVRIFDAAVLVAVIPAAFTRRELQTIFWKVAILWGGILSLAGLMQLFLSLGRHGTRVHSLFVTPNTFAGYLLIALPVAFALRRQARTGGEKRLWAACGLLIAAAFAASGSRGAWLALLGAGVIGTAALLLSRRLTLRLPAPSTWRRQRVLLLAVLICASVLAFQVIQDREMAKRLLSLSHPLSAEPERYRYWASTLEIVRGRPWLGYGLQTFRFIYVGSKSRDLGSGTQFYAHNDYLQMAAETGLVGLGLFLLLSTLVASLGWRALRRGEGPLAAALALGLWGVLLHSFVDFDFHIPAIQTLFWLGVAFLLTRGDAAPPGAGAPAAPPARRGLVVGAVILLAACVSGTVGRHYLAERASAHGFLLLRQRELAGARRRFTDAVRLVPYSSHHLAGLARVAILEGEGRNDARPLREAEKILHSALALNPFDADTRLLLAQLYSRNLGLLGEQSRPALVALLEEGIARLPNADVFRRQLGRVLLEGGEPARAVDPLKRHIAWWPRDTDARLWLAEAYSRSGRPDEASVHAKEVLALSPDDARARALLAPAAGSPAPPPVE